jgi:hypothetical protein
VYLGQQLCRDGNGLFPRLGWLLFFSWKRGWHTHPSNNYSVFLVARSLHSTPGDNSDTGDDLVSQLHAQAWHEMATLANQPGGAQSYTRPIFDCIVTPENARALPRMHRDEKVVFCFLGLSVLSHNTVFKALLHLPREK